MEKDFDEYIYASPWPDSPDRVATAKIVKGKSVITTRDEVTREEVWNKIIENIEESIRALEMQLETMMKAKELDRQTQLQREQYLEP